VALPATVPKGYVYIPPGSFLLGSADQDDVRKFLRSAPLRRSRLAEGFVIGQTEVTVGDWMAYLQSLPEGAPQRHLLARLPDGIGGMELTQAPPPGSSWRFALRLESGQRLDASAGQNILYPGRSHHQEQDWRLFPLAGVSAEDLKGYLGWLDRTGRLPGARLCNELEWTRAARGADDRRYPHGNGLENDDANIDMTYGIQRDARGPDAARAHPESVSPFGLFDMAGNAFEIVEPVTRDLDELLIRGGSWYYSSVSTSVANRQSFKWKLRDARVGFRVCTTFPVP
jgi:formylglycine-generating enzyme required for sulfatase activity